MCSAFSASVARCASAAAFVAASAATFFVRTSSAAASLQACACVACAMPAACFARESAPSSDFTFASSDGVEAAVATAAFLVLLASPSAGEEATRPSLLLLDPEPPALGAERSIAPPKGKKEN